MDNSILYQHRFGELLKLFKRSGKNSFEKMDSTNNDYVIDISGNSFREYKRLIDRNEGWVIYTVNTLIKGLLDSYGIEYKVPEYEEKKSNGRIAYKHPFAFTMTKEGKTIGYIFCYYVKKGLIDLRNYFRQFNDIDTVRVYEIRKDLSEQIYRCNTIEADEDNSYLWFGVVKDFFDDFFTNEEYTMFVDYADTFNEQAKYLIGYKMMALPTDDAITSFKAKKAKMLHDEFDNYTAMVAKALGEDQFSIIKHNYIDKGYYQLITAESYFADSFISSEWYYGIHSITGTIDETGVVTGYLKSIEQLLYDVLKLFIGRKGKRIGIDKKKQEDFDRKYPGENVNGRIPFKEEYSYYFDTTLGSLINFIKYKNNSGAFFNKDYFDVGHDSIQYLVNALYEFKDYFRNDRLHKDNLYTFEEVRTIRSKAIVLYSMILGCFSIKSEDLKNLGLESPQKTKSLTNEELTNAISSWITPILVYDMPDDTKILAFLVNKFPGRPWNLCLQGLYGIDNDKYDTVEWNYKQSYSSSYYNGWFVWDSEIDYAKGVEQLKAILYSLINSDDKLGILLKNYPEIVIGNTNVIEVLYKK